ncbi:MAG: hypothetical protein H6650_01125 [Ardenticatenales bacterium]|nr:hypothetical protein [Ardenticatenales bacterium]
MRTYRRSLPFALLLLGLFAVFIPLLPLRPAARAADDLPPIIFVARAHLATPDDIFGDEVGPAGQFGTGLTKYAPGSRLVRRNADGSLFVYETPGLVDVQSPDVSFDAQRILFAGAKTLNPDHPEYGWRLYEINVDGSGFHQLTFADRDITIPNAADFGNLETYYHYNDLFPAYLADGRIVFASSRYPTRAHYDERASYNLYVMNGDGSGLHRITTERAGLLHPTPLPDGRILATRWWNQFNQPANAGIYNRIDNANHDQLLPDGTLIYANPDATFNPATGMLPGGTEIREAPNTWHLMVLNPDGAELRRFVWTPRYWWSLTDDAGIYDTYAATQPAPLLHNNHLYIAYTAQTDSSMVHTTLKTGIRIGQPEVSMMAANTTPAIAGLDYDKAWGDGDESGPYALHPWGLPDGRILYAQSREDNSLPHSGTYQEGFHFYDLQGSNLRYELYWMNLDGSAQTPVWVDLAGIGLPTADVMDAKPISPRVGWTSLPDAYADAPSDDPLWGNLPNDLPQYAFSQRGRADILTATIHNPNVYANAPLDLPYVNNSPPPGSVAYAQVWVDANQFTGAYCYPGENGWPDWPQPCDNFRQDNQVRAVLWTQVSVDAHGAFTATVPADTMGFIVLRDVFGRAITGWNRGYVSIAQGSAYARPGEVVTCTGCHMGHVSGSLDTNLAEAKAGWTNVAPYAEASASSIYDDSFLPANINDRRGWVPAATGAEPFQDDSNGWISASGHPFGEWVELNWPRDMLIQRIRLVGPPPSGGDWDGFGQPVEDGDYYVRAGLLELSLDGQIVASVNVGRVHALSDGGTTITLPQPLIADHLRFKIQSVHGRWWWENVAALNEIEVIGRAATPTSATLQHVYLSFLRR